MTSEINKKIGYASLIMMASVFLSKLAGVVRIRAIAHVGGNTPGADAYQFAFILPEILNHILASGFLSITFIPIFSKYITEHNEEEGWRVFSIILSTLGTVLFILLFLSLFFTGPLVNIFAPGIENPEVFKMTVNMTRIVIPAQFFFFAGGLFMAVQYAKEKFLIPAMAPLIYNLGIIFIGLILSQKKGMEGFAWGVLIASFTGNFFIQYLGARKCGMKLSFIINFRHPELRKYVILTLPFMIGLTMTFSMEFFPKFFGSFLPEGNVACFDYSLRIMLFLVGFFGQAIGVAIYPYLAKLASEKKNSELNHLLNRTLNYISLIIPFSILFIILRKEIVYVVLKTGNFGASAFDLSTDILIYLLIGSFAFATQTVVSRGFYALKSTIKPALYGTAGVIVSIPFYYLGMKYYGIRGIAVALVISVLLQVTFIFTMWNRESGNRGYPVYLYYLKMFLISLPLGISIYTIKEFLFEFPKEPTIILSLISSSIIFLIFLILLTLLGYLFKINEIKDIISMFKTKIMRRVK